MRRHAVLVFVALAAAPGSVPAQGVPPVAPDVRVELVQLDVVVTDAQGSLVRDLTREDFEVLEDGKPQRVAQFLIARRSPAVAASPVTPAEAASPGLTVTAAPPTAPASGPGRRIVIVVDDLHIARGNIDYAKQALERVVTDFVAPEDQVALVTTAGGPQQQFTRDRAALRSSVARLGFREAAIAPARSSRMTPAQAELILKGDRAALQLAARVMVEEPGSIYNAMSPQVAAAASGGSPAASTGTDTERAAERDAERQARAVLAESLRFSSASLGIVEDVLRSMAGLPGRKIVLLVSDGFLVGTATSEERTRDMQRLIDAATRSGGVVYALDTHGLVPTGGDAAVAGTGAPPGLQTGLDRQSEQLFRETLRGVTAATGGFLVHGTNDFTTGLRRMLEDNDAYYLLAYEPTNTKRDGRFRKIEVRLPRHRDFAVRTRKGYFATDDRKRPTLEASAGAPAPPIAWPRTAVPVPAAVTEAEARAMLSAPLTTGIPIRLAADYLELPTSGPQAVVRASVEVAGLRFHDAQGRQQATVDLVGGVFDAKGEPVGSPFGRRLELDLDAAEYKKATEAGLDYQQRVALKPGRYQVRFVAHETSLAQSGGAAQWIDIPDLAEKKLAMSGVFLSDVEAGTAGGGEPLREASTRHRFARGGSFSFQIYLYNPAVDEKGASDVVLQAQVWSAGKAVAASKPQPAALRQKDGAPLPETNVVGLQGLAPGPYELRVVAVDRKANATIFRVVDFTVE